MRRTLSIALFAVLVACGSKPKPSTTPPPPLADTKPEPKPEPTPDPAAKPKEPPAPAGPIDATVAATKASYKLTSPGKGKRSAIKLSAKTGAKQTVEVAMDFAGKQTAPPELGGTKEDVAPTVVLAGDLEVKDVDKDGAAKFQLTVASVDARDKPGAKTTGAEFKGDLAGLTGMTVAGNVDASGKIGDLTLHIEKPDAKSEGALGLVKLSLMPLWPLLPTEPIGVGAKWAVTTTLKIADRLDVTQVTNYELISHKGTEWVVKGTSKVTGSDQEIEGAKFGKIGGGGAIELTIADGSFLPKSATTLSTDFTATAGTADKPIALVFHLDQGVTVTPK